MVCDGPLLPLASEGQLLEIPGGNVGIVQAGVADEAEPPIIGRVAQDDTTACPERSEPFEPGLDQAAADAASLLVGPHGNRTQAISIRNLPGDFDG